MKKYQMLMTLVVSALAISACSVSDGNSLPENGPPMLSDCIEPYLVARVAVLGDDEDPLYVEGLYAEGRILNIVVVGVTMDNAPMTFTDYETGQETTFVWQTTHITDLLEPYSVCVEYQFDTVEALRFEVSLVGQPNDWMSLEVESYLDETRNLCISPFGDFDAFVVEYAQATIDLGSTTTNVGCIVPIV